MPRIFISYKRVDKEAVFAIKDRVEAALGERCWIDLDGIESDAEFMSVIIGAINKCEVMLFMYSKTHLSITNMDTDWTMRELSFAEKKNKRIVFVNIDDSPLSDAFEFAYGTKQQVLMSSEHGFDKLIDDLRRWLGPLPASKKHLAVPAPAPAESAKPAETPKPAVTPKPVEAPKPAEPKKPVETTETKKPVAAPEPKKPAAEPKKKSNVPMIAAAVAVVVAIVAAVVLWPKSESETTAENIVKAEPQAVVTAQVETAEAKTEPVVEEVKETPAETTAQAAETKPAETATASSSTSTQQSSPSNTDATQQKTALPKAQKTGTHNGHEYVDLGLPSGVKWASMNVGATSASDYGQYFAWGETSNKADYKKSTYTNDSEAETLTPNGGHDVARSKWGGNWRMPTEDDFDELDNYCTWTWTSQGGHGGYKITSDKNGSSIFLPASGWTLGTDVKRMGESGYYWTAEVGSASDGDARYLDFDKGMHTLTSNRKFSGMTVRPVMK